MSAARGLLVAVVLAGCGARLTEPPTVVVASPPPASAEPAEPPAAKAPDPLPPVELALDWSRMCARVDGRVHCGPLDDPDRPLTAEPPLGGIEDAVSLAAGRSFFCLATRRGTVHCEGDNHFGQLGARLRDERHEGLVQVEGIHDARRVVAGQMHACAILGSGRVSCWGRNEHGETGSGVAYAPEARELAVPAEVPGIEGVTSVAASFSTTCATTSARELWCWGSAQLPDHQQARGDHSEVPARLERLAGTLDLTGGESVFCGVGEGAIRCWGSLWTFLGNNRKAEGGVAEIPVPARVRRVRVSDHHGCALLADGRVACFGAGYGGVLGIPGPESFDAQPARIVPDLPRAVDVAVGPITSCAVTAGSDVYCWGSLPGKSRRKEPVPRRIAITR